MTPRHSFAALSAEFGPLSARERRILTLGIRGGDGDDPLDLDALLARAEGLEDLADEDLAALEADLIAAAQLLLETPTDESLEQGDRIVAAVGALRTAAAERIAHAEQNAERAAAIQEALVASTEEGGEGDGQNEGEGEGGSGEGAETEHTETTETERHTETTETTAAAELPAAEPEAEPLAAAATTVSTPVVSRVAARRPAHTKPLVKPAKEFKLIASANSPSVPAGTVLDTPDKVVEALEPAIRAAAGYRGPTVNIPLFSLGAYDPTEVFGPARVLGRDPIANEEKILAVAGEKALRGTGGICIPPQIDYTLPVLAHTDARPVRDSYARFGATRGGVRLLPPPILSQTEGAIGIWTEANDQAPGTDGPATKPCITIDCPEEYEVLVAAITQCLRIGNFRARFFPEQVEAWVKLVAVQHAKVAENRLIQKMGDESTQVDVPNVLGVTRTVLNALDRLAAGTRSHHRLDPMYPFRFQGPYWLLNAMISDLARGMQQGTTDERLAMAESQIAAFMTSKHYNVTWFLDGEAGQTFDLQADGDLADFPAHAIAYVYIEGTWIHLDGGSLDFGIVRDSTLNAVNDFQMFSEDFEESVFHGTPGTSHRLNIEVCASGEAAPPGDPVVCVGS